MFRSTCDSSGGISRDKCNLMLSRAWCFHHMALRELSACALEYIYIVNLLYSGFLFLSSLV
jgi:hypothetical protein